MSGLLRRQNRESHRRRGGPLDWRKFKPKSPDADPREVEVVHHEAVDALRRGAEEPDQNRKVGKLFEDVLDTLHSKDAGKAPAPTTSEREADEVEEEALLLALRRKLRGTLRGQGIVLDAALPDGHGTGYVFFAHDGEGRAFECLFSFADGMALGADSPVGVVDKIVAAVHTRMCKARDDYYARACVTPAGVA